MIIKLIYRTFRQHKYLFLIKLLSLSLALSGVVLISAFVKQELSYDASFTAADKIYRFSFTHNEILDGRHFARIPASQLVVPISAAVPEVESTVRLKPFRSSLIQKEKQNFIVNQAFECDSNFFDFFDVEILYKNTDALLDNPYSMVLSQTMAKKLFGESYLAVGKTLLRPAGQYYANAQLYTVTGVMADFPINTHFHPEIVTSATAKEMSNGWAWTYLMLNENTDLVKTTEAINLAVNNWFKSGEAQVYLQNIKEIHLASHKLREIETNSNTRSVYVLIIAALVLLLIAISNYINLSEGMRPLWQKYIVVSQINGATHRVTSQLYLSELIGLISPAYLLSIFLVFSGKVMLSRYFDLNLKIDTYSTLIPLIGFTSLVALAVFILSKRKVKAKHTKGNIRQGLIVMQYAMTIALLSAVIIIARQSSYAIKLGLGDEKSQMLCLENAHLQVQQKFPLFKQNLLKHASIESVTASLEPPGGEANDRFMFEMEGYQPNKEDNSTNDIGVLPFDYSFAETFNLVVIAGEGFSDRAIDQEGNGEYILNETAIRFLGFSTPAEAIGKSFKLVSNYGNIPSGKVKGVVRDFHLSNLKTPVEPLVLFKRENLWLGNLTIKFKEGQEQAALNALKEEWSLLFEGYPLHYERLDEMYYDVYQSERIQLLLLSLFTAIAIIVLSMGILGISLIVSTRRRKEIGIRKVNGANSSEVVLLLVKDFLIWLGLAFIIAIPIAYYVMQQWIENFVYRIALSWWIFAIAGLVTLIISMGTVVLQSWKAATRNPVEALRYE